ncbi:MAG: universal stress protein, partial [Anaerolineae bacterium]
MSDCSDCIVCATRGGEGSRAVQREAIRIADSQNKHLIFLYVIDTSDMVPMDEGLLPAIKKEMFWLGRTLVLIAQKRARLEGIQADVALRDGDVPTEIGKFLQEANASLLLLGAPRGTTANVFGDDAVELFAAEIEERTGVPVQLVRPESVSLKQV